jgi:acetyl-CoA carboxylase biotin carboxyl carrier protein
MLPSIRPEREQTLNLAELKEILQILEEQSITEFELEQDGVKLRICRGAPAGNGLPAAPPHGALHVAAPVVVPADPAGSAPAPKLTVADSAPARAETSEVVVKSPIVGTFYRAPDAGAPAFVSVGDTVKVGQVLCIIEAMKLMNEIEAEVAGEILMVHPENGQPVQYGDALFTIRPA